LSRNRHTAFPAERALAAPRSNGMASQTTDALSPERLDEQEPGRGRAARRPSQIPPKGWQDILWRVGSAYFGDRIGFVAGGVTFFTLLSIFPAITAFVSLYGLFADPATAHRHFDVLYGFLPASVVQFLSEQAVRVASGDTPQLSLTFAGSLLFSLWSANASVRSLFYGLNIAYHETEKRNLIRYNVLTLAFTAGGILFVVATTALVVVAPVALSFLGWEGGAADMAVLRWPLLFVIYVAALSVMYRYGPCRSRARWRWLTWGAVFAALLNLLISALYNFWLSNIANLDAAYGSLGAIMGFMIWTQLSIVAILMGAEVNAEIEHQTARDTTTGPEKPMGERGAIVADTLGARKGAPAAVGFTLKHAEELSRRALLRKGGRSERAAHEARGKSSPGEGGVGE
jgi:membrane protein